MNERRTGELLAVLNRIDADEQLEEFVARLPEPDELTLAAFLQQQIEAMGSDRAKVIKDSNLYRTYGYQIIDGRRNPSRDKLICLCVAMELGYEQTQRALRLAGLGALYVKKRRDAIISFGLNQKMNIMEINELLYDMQEDILE